MGGVIFFIVLIYLIFSRRRGSKTGDQRANEYGWVLGLWGLALMVHVSLAQWHWARPLYMAGLSVLLFPSLYSALTAAMGKVKTSYWLGRMGFFYFGRNPHAGGLLRGFQAALRQRDPEAFRASLRWLKRRQLARRKTLYSGEMVIYVLIDALLASRPHPEDIAARLERLRGIGTASIPAGVSALALRYALAPALAGEDWERIARVCDQWDTPATNPLAKYLKEFYGQYVKGGPIYTKMNLAYWRLRAWRHRSVCDYARNWRRDRTTRAAESATPLQRLWRESGPPADLTEALLSPDQRMRWERRALALGVRRFDGVWHLLEESVALVSGAEHSRELTQADYDYIDYQHKTLHYLSRSLEKKLARKELGQGVECYLDWLGLLQALESLKPYRQAQLTAFSAIHGVVWNWVAALWNKRKERCLVHFIATHCSPLARDGGHQELHKILSGLTGGDYR